MQHPAPPSTNQENPIIWTVFRSPADYPGMYVARAFNYDKPTGYAFFSATLEGVRAKLPPGLTKIERSPGDEPPVVESWL